MSVSSISSPTASQLYPAPWTVGTSSSPATLSGAPKTQPDQLHSDFASLLSAVQSGDMSSAQQALTAVQSDVSAADATYSPSSQSGSSQPPSALQSLFNAVQSGDATGAQQALTQLKSGHGHHHHHHASGGTNDQTSTSTTTDQTTPTDQTNDIAASIAE